MTQAVSSFFSPDNTNQYWQGAPVVWAIGGSDCTGGAGIQADTKTIHNLGGLPNTIITAVTAQNAGGVKEINAVSDEVFRSQWSALEQAAMPSTIKVGMLANEAQVNTLVTLLTELNQTCEEENWPRPIIVYDPVLAATSGDQLTESDLVPLIRDTLFPLVDVVTPNAKEVQKFAGTYMFSKDCMQHAAEAFIQLGCKKVVIKGGHIDLISGRSIDLAMSDDTRYWLNGDQIPTEHHHGTGCTFASAIAVLVAKGYHFRDAVTLAKGFITQGLIASTCLEGAYGPVLQTQLPSSLAVLPQTSNTWLTEWEDGPNLDTQPALSFPRINSDLFNLYPVVDSLEWLERLLKLGVTTIQYRDKTNSGEALEAAIQKAILLGKQYNAQLFINDYWQLAIKHQAYGVHLGQEDVQSADLNAIAHAKLRLGISTHGHFEFINALAIKPSYLAIGAVFPTKTKDMTGQIQGLSALKAMCALQGQIPIVAIGGITLSNASQVLTCGAQAIAVVTAITEAKDPEHAVKQLSSLFE